MIFYIPLGRNPLTLTTTLTLPPGVMLFGGVIGLATAVLDRSDGLEALEASGVPARSSLRAVRAGAMTSHKRSIQSSNST